MHDTVAPRFKGTPGATGTRQWTCRNSDPACTRVKPCRSCLGRRNRRKGARKQSGGLKTLEQVSGAIARWRGRRSNEETADHLPVRFEAKAGKGGGANTIWTHFRKARDQSEAARAIGDVRPFVAYYAPDGLPHGLFVIEEPQLSAVVSALGGEE
jgi:hypothetical protein